MYPQLRQKALRAAGVSPGKTPCCYFAERCRSSDAVGRSVGPSYTTDGGGVDQLAKPNLAKQLRVPVQCTMFRTNKLLTLI